MMVEIIKARNNTAATDAPDGFDPDIYENNENRSLKQLTS